MGVLDDIANKPDVENIPEKTKSSDNGGVIKKTQDKNNQDSNANSLETEGDSFERIVKINYSLVNEKLGNNYLGSFSYLVALVEKTKDKNFKIEADKIFSRILKEDDGLNISNLLLEMQGIAARYKQEKQDVVKKTKAKKDEMKEEEVLTEDDVEQIEDPSKFIKSFLDANKGRIDGSLTKVSKALEQAEKMSAEEIGAMLHSNSILDGDIFFKESWNFLDVEPEDWDYYFKEHNIPKDKQDQLKVYYSRLMEDKDFGNLQSFSPDFGTKIADEAKRIESLDEGDIIKIEIDELNPSNGGLEFETKKEALLYLYYNKILLREVATLMQDIIVGGKNIGSFVGGIGEIISDDPGLVFGALLGYMGLNTFGSINRYMRSWLVRKQSGSKHRELFNLYTWIQVKGEYLNDPSKSSGTVDPDLLKEYGEYTRREGIIKYLEEKYKGDNKKLKKIQKLKKWLPNLDHDIQITKSKNLKVEGTFWREVAYIEASGFKGPRKIIDIFFKFYLGSSEQIIEKIKSDVKVYEEIKKELFDDLGDKKSKTFLTKAENYLKRSHNIPNDMEEEVLKTFDKYVKKIKNKEMWFILGKDKTETLKNIKTDLLKEIKNNTGLDLDESIFKNGSNLADARDLFFKNYDPKNLSRGVDPVNAWVELKLKGFSFSDDQKLEIEKFFAEIDNGLNEYNQRTSLDIVARIVKKNLKYEDAIKESFEIKWDHIRQIGVSSDFRGSLDSLLKLIDTGAYSLDVDKTTKRAKIDKTKTSTAKTKKETRQEAKEAKAEAKRLKESVKKDLVALEKLDNVDKASVTRKGRVEITFSGFVDAASTKKVKRKVVLDIDKFSGADGILRLMGTETKLVLSDSNQLIKDLLLLDGLEVKDMKNRVLLNSKEYLKKKYTNIINSIKSLSVRDQAAYLKDKFGSMKNIPSYFLNKYEKLGAYINYKRFSSILKPLRMELLLRGQFDAAEEVRKGLVDMNNDPKYIVQAVKQLEGVKQWRTYFADKYINGDEIRSRVELNSFIKEFRNIDFDSIISMSDMKARIRKTFDIEADFKLHSIDDVKKLLKKVRRI